jgi:iron(III) transport system substrate-binding protein
MGVLDPRFKGRFAVSPLACGVCYAGVQMFLTQKGYGPEFFQKVAAQKPSVYASTVVGLDRVIAGEADFVFWSFENAALPKLQQGAPIAWVRPNPTPLFPNSWLGISANAPNPNAARLFVNWTLSEEGARALQRNMGAFSTIKGVPDERDVIKQPWYQPIREVYHVDFDRWEKRYDEDMKIWADALKRAQ